MRRNAFVRNAGVAAMLAAAFAVAPPGARAQFGISPVILTLPGSTAAVATGGAYLLRSIQSDAVFYNPALVRGTGSLILSHERYGDAASLTSASIGTSVNFTFGLRVLDYGAAVCCIARHELELPLGGASRAGEIEGVVGYARTIHGLRLGGAAKWVQQWNGSASQGTPAFDVGFTMNPFGLAVGLAVQNIGTGPDVPNNFGGRDPFEVLPTTYDLPRREQIIVSTDSHELGPLDFEATGEMHMTREDDLAGGLGVELSYWPFSGLTFIARGGARIGNQSILLPASAGGGEIKHGVPTAGAGVQYKRFTFEYAWEPYSGASDAHRFGVRIN